jgi:hypothetical protein
MIDNTDNITPFVPSDSMRTELLTQRHLDECSRAIGRPLWDYEVKILDDLMTVQEKVNRKLAKQGKLNRTHSLDELVHLFCQRVMTKDAQKLTDAIMADGGKKDAIYKQLQQIADR